MNITEKIDTYLNEGQVEKYDYVEDGWYSRIEKSSNGEYSSFSKAKKELVKSMKSIMDEFKSARQNIKSLRKDTLEGEGNSFEVIYDGPYSTIINSDNGEFTSFTKAKKELASMFDQRISDYRFAWKNANSLSKKDIE